MNEGWWTDPATARAKLGSVLRKMETARIEIEALPDEVAPRKKQALEELRRAKAQVESLIVDIGGGL